MYHDVMNLYGEYANVLAIRDMIIKTGESCEVIKKSGSWFSYGDTKLAQGRESLKQVLRDNPELIDELQEKIRTALAEKAEQQG